MREEFVRLALAPGANKRELMRRFGISAPTGYKWIKRFECGGPEALKDQSRRPKGSPGRTPACMERMVVEARTEFPDWGGRKLARVLKNRGVRKVPSASTITEILRRHGLLGGSEEQRGNHQRFQRARPNELWQMDFKGDFQTHDGRRCYALTTCDDHSRFNIVLQACPDMKTGTVEGHLKNAFERYGLPQAILCDNGPPWASNWTRGQTKLEVWLMLLGVRMIHGRPYHPQTQGKEERFHRTLNVELLRRSEGFANLARCQQAFERWRHRYNWIRPHDSLEMEVPGACYECSQRPFPEPLPDARLWYLPEDALRKVHKTGVVEFQGKRLLVGEGFGGHRIALRHRGGQLWEMHFASHVIGTYDLSENPPRSVAIRPLDT